MNVFFIFSYNSMDFYTTSFNKIRAFKPKIKDSSINSYLLNIKKISKELFNSTKPSINYFRDLESIKEYLNNINSIASKKNMITSILVLIKSYSDMIPKETIEMYNIYHKELSSQQEENYLDNVKTDKEKNNWTTTKDILLKIDSIMDDINTWKGSNRQLVDKYQQHLVLNLYTLLPPLRNDYAIVKVVNDIHFDENEDTINTSFNYINLATHKLFLCNYKTNKFYGIKKIDIPHTLLEIITNWEIIKKKHYGSKLTHDFLLLNTTNLNPMKHNTLTKYINKIFSPKKISSTLLRKIYISEKYPVINTFREMQNDSFVMGHNIEMARKVYSKK